jgi:predicted Zn-dependent protease
MRRIAAGLMAAALVIAGQASPRAHVPSDPVVDQKKTDKEKEADKKAEQQEESYHQLVEYAEGMYRNDKSTFRVEVDKQYQDLMRAHADRAYRVNLSAKSEVKFILEDRFRSYSGLYDNLLIQDVVNTLGQKVAPSPSRHLFAFKLIADPVPYAEALATGTIYISTGLVALLENQAQLAYVLAHEAAHVHREHWFHRVQLGAAQPYYDAEKGRAADSKNPFKTVPPRVGQIFGFGGKAAAIGAAIETGTKYATFAISKAKEDEKLNVDWVKEEEDEADEVAFAALLDAEYNVNQIPKMYVLLQDVARLDERSTLGFLGNPQRVAERHENAQLLIQKAQDRIQGRALKGDGPEFKQVMAELKRDNGILAYHYDMLQIARANLEDAVLARQTDPAALYYYAKVLKLVGKEDSERAEAADYFVKAIKQDKRNENYGAYLHQATTLLGSDDPIRKQQAADALKTYIAKYGCAMGASRTAQSHDLPPHLDTIYDYLNVLGQQDWMPFENKCGAPPSSGAGAGAPGGTKPPKGAPKGGKTTKATEGQ